MPGLHPGAWLVEDRVITLYYTLLGAFCYIVNHRDVLDDGWLRDIEIPTTAIVKTSSGFNKI